jgi:ATPase subunit of ABC transporter with duplicated ATPase domains
MKCASYEHEMAGASGDQPPDGALCRMHGRFEALEGYDFPRRMQEALDWARPVRRALSRPMSTLSGGERMRVALARILLMSRTSCFLDEPTNHSTPVRRNGLKAI